MIDSRPIVVDWSSYDQLDERLLFEPFTMSTTTDAIATTTDAIATDSIEVVPAPVQEPKKIYMKYTHICVPRVCFKRVLPFAIGLAKQNSGFAQNHYEDSEIVMCHRDRAILDEMVEKVSALVHEVEVECTLERKSVMEDRMKELRDEFHVVRRHIGGLDPAVVEILEASEDVEIIIDYAFEFLARKVADRFKVSSVEATRMCKNSPISLTWDVSAVTVAAPKQILQEMMADVRGLIGKVRRQQLVHTE